MTLMCVFFGFLEITNGFVNVALNKPAHQLYPYRSGDDRCDASNAVDGRKSDLNLWGGQCAVSADYKQTATWWVNLTSIHNIHHITIYFLTNNAPTLDFQRTYANFYLGFSLYVSKTTDMHQGTLCFKDNHFTMYTLPAVFTATCHAHGQYVIYYNERRNTYRRGFTLNVYSNLCEVEVYGCPKTGFYGSHCSIPCPDANCQYCHIETGTCQSCKPGFRGQRCEFACSVGYFGQDCTEKCKSSCKGCNHVTGLCDSGCQSGWIGDFCEQECKEGNYGDEYILDCGRCRNKTKCHHVDGTCVDGCEPGYKLEYCQQPCEKGLYGVDCREFCGHCHDISQCSNINGTCLTGCDAGYEGVLCKQPCDEGSYGGDCNETCGHCLDVKQCSKINGTCLTGCDTDYKGDTCKALIDWSNSTATETDRKLKDWNKYIRSVLSICRNLQRPRKNQTLHTNIMMISVSSFRMNDRGRCGICCVCCGLFCWRVKRFIEGSNQNNDNRLNSEGLFNAGLTLEESPEVRNAPLDVSLQSLDPSSNGENVPIQHSDHQLHTREVSAQMESRIVKTVLSTGVDRQRVMQVIERRLRETGDNFLNPEDLLNAVLTLQQNHVSPQQDNTDTSQPPMIEVVLDTGVNWNSVMQVIERRLIETGVNYQTAEELLDAVITLEQNSETNSTYQHPDYEDYIAAMVLEESQGSDFIIPDTTPLPYTSGDSLNANTLTSDHPVDTEVLRVDMQQPIVLSVLETGVDRNDVKTVIERRLSETGEDFPNVQELMDAVLAFDSNTRYSNVHQGISRLPVPLDASPGNASYRTQAAKLAEENRQLRQQKVCKVCLDAEIGMVFLPCGHLCCCQACAPNVGQCPVCRANINNRVHVFIP
ncbi:uncharacterized protein LOC128183607 [Crassostrea angulata]|uniref:uncharacterized protein LOC128183607 n=1 Tax=Magallana angulata TaxID=2784310 RepID=UPI0022B1477D|nr:uncharacterized protein LOC128183607 [Crassostrea angulata]